MEGGDQQEGVSSSSSSPATTTNVIIPAGLTAAEHSDLLPTISAHHTYRLGRGQCSSLLAQRVRAPASAVWSFVRRFDSPQIYKHFVRRCALKEEAATIRPGCLRELSVISGLPASTSTERLDVLDDRRMVTGFTIVGGEHRLSNYRSVTTVTELTNEADDDDDAAVLSVVLESYVVDVPEGNTDEDTRMFADTVIRLNLQKLASVAEALHASTTRGGQVK